MERNSKYIIGIIIAVLVICVIVYTFHEKGSSTQVTGTTTEIANSATTSQITWQTYANYGFSVEYPSGWTVTDYTGMLTNNPQMTEVNFTPPGAATSTDSQGFAVTANTINGQNGNASSSLNRYTGFFNKLGFNLSQQNLTVGGVPATQLNLSSSSLFSNDLSHIFFDKGSETYELEVSSSTYDQMFPQFYNSFKFTN